MGRFRSTATGVVFSVDDSKDGRYRDGFVALTDGPDDSPPPSKWDALKVDELKAEIASRNEDRDEENLLPVDGKKADLVAVLDADDAAQQQ